VKRRGRKRPTHPLLAAVVACVFIAVAAAIVADIAFRDTPDIYLLPLECFVPVFFAVIIYINQRRSFLAFRRQRDGDEWMKAGLCPACGYNLKCNTSGLCPECGMPVNSKTVPIQNPSISN
jgi:uncharacterized paraquat-inducible protein A